MKNGTKTNNRILVLVFLHILLGLFALSDVASKYAALSEPLSLRFFVCYGIVLVILAVYALGWQQVIKRMPLSSAYANRAITIIWGIFWGAVLFGEAVTPGKIIGAVIIMAGIVLFAWADNEEPAEIPDAKVDALGEGEAAASKSFEAEDFDGSVDDGVKAQHSVADLQQPDLREVERDD